MPSLPLARRLRLSSSPEPEPTPVPLVSTFHPSTAMSELRILTFNVWGLALISKDRAPRLAALAATLAGSDYDIVCLQEIWVHSEFEAVRDDIKGALPYSRFFHTGALGSGLAIFSRLPIIEAHALPYALSGNPHQAIQGDFFVNKAAARAVLAHPHLGEIEVWNTHMHAAGESGPEVAQAHRMTQAWQLATEVRRAKGRYVFVMGDFNSQPFSIPIALMRTYGGLRDSFLDTHPGANDAAPPGLSATDALTTLGMTCDSPLNSWSAGKPIPPNITAQGGKRLDYIFYSGPPSDAGGGTAGVRCTHSEVVLTGLVPGQDFSFSDHFGLTSTFAFGPDESDDDADLAKPKSTASSHPLLDDQSEWASTAVPTLGPYEPTPTGHRSTSTITAADASGAIRAALATIHEYTRLAAQRARLQTCITAACIVAVVALAVGSAWQPKSWIQPIFTIVAFALGAGGATMLYTGWLWGRWERGLLDETVAEMELELRVLGR